MFAARCPRLRKKLLKNVKIPHDIQSARVCALQIGELIKMGMQVPYAPLLAALLTGDEETRTFLLTRATTVIVK